MFFPNVNSEVRPVVAVVAWHWELEHLQLLLLGPLLVSEGDPAVLFSSFLPVWLNFPNGLDALSIFWLATWRLCNSLSVKVPLVSRESNMFT